MGKSKPLSGIFAGLAMLLLILDSKTALMSAAEGMELCLKTVVPSLFPFFLLSGILVRDLTGRRIPILGLLGNALGMPEGAEPLLISGFLGGYPVGAKAIRDAWAAGSLTKTDAERLLAFCNNAGPAFLFGMAAPMFSSPLAGWVLWGIHILSALTVGLLTPGKADGRMHPAAPFSASITDGLKSALSVTAQVCGWVILFRILNGFLTRWFLWLLPEAAQTAVTGVLELANGCLELSNIESERMRFVLCSAMLSFGGLSVLMQTHSAANGLSMKYYLSGKLLQIVFSLLYSTAYVLKIPAVWLIPLPALLLGKKLRNRGGNPGTVGV